ncbi:hypothetical protein MNBD_ALPHA06-45, partial [hydrothermal vent metagenome]
MLNRTVVALVADPFFSLSFIWQTCKTVYPNTNGVGMSQTKMEQAQHILQRTFGYG